MELINGIIVSALTELAKRIQAIPVTPEQTARIRMIGIGLSFAATLVTAWASGTLTSSAAIPVIAASLTTWMLSVISYHSFIKK